ncbi:MAG: hypothetical protein HDQ88_08360, partial [Clostridia bacterium]|nr:hypothetical protein [Clostridia bacterium]
VRGIAQLSDAVHATSAARITALTKVTDLWHAANLRVGKGLVGMGVAANTARIAAIALNGALTMGIGAAIGIAVGFITKLVEKHREAKKAAEEAAAKRREAFEGYASSVGQHAGGVIAKFETLKQQYDDLGDSLSAKKKFIAENADAFRELGVKVSDVNDADNLFIRNAGAFVAALQQRAQAAAAMELAGEKYKQAIQKMVEAEGVTSKTSNGGISTTGLSRDQQKQLKKVMETAANSKRVDLGAQRAAIYYPSAEIEKMVRAAGVEAGIAYVDSIRNGIANEASKLTAEGDRIISLSIAKNNTASQQLSGAGITTTAEAQAAENARREAAARAEAETAAAASAATERARIEEQCAQQLQEIHRQTADATLSEEERRIGEIKSRYAKLKEEVAAMLAAGSIDRSQAQALNAQIDVAEQQEILNQLLDGIKTYEQQRSEIQEKYQEKRKSLYQDDGETLKEGVTQGNVEETNYQEEEALAALDEAFAQREATYQVWMEQIAAWSLDTLKQALERAEQELQTLEESGKGDSKQLSTARAKVHTLEKQVEKEDAKTSGDSAASDKGIKNWQKLGKTLTSVGSSFHEIGEAIGGTAGEALSLVGTIASTTASIIDGIETLVNGTVEGVKTTTETASTSIQAMETASVVLAIISAALKIAMAIAKFVQRESAATKHYEELKAKYESLVDVWDDLIARKQRYIDTSWGKELTAVNDQTQALIQQKIESQRALAVARAAAGASSGSHSYGYRMWQGSYKANGQNWKDVAGDINKELGVNIRGMADFASLSAEQLLWIKEHYAELWASMDGDYKDALEHIIEYEDEAKEALKAYKEQLTQISFDDLYSNFVDTLMDMDASSEDFANNLSEMLMRAVLSSMMGQKYAKQLEQWYDRFSQYMKDSDGRLTEEQIKALKEEYMGYVDTAIAERDQIVAITGYGSKEAAAQSASARGFEAMSQETGDELNGRFTAIQGDVHDIKAFILQLTDNGTMQLNETINIRDIMIQLNGHVADIRSYTRVLPAMHDTLASMNRKLDNL